MAGIIGYQPVRLAFGGMTREFDRVFERLFDETIPRATGRSTRVAGVAGTAANLYESPEAFLVELPLPGVRSEDVEITVQENVLALKAKRAWETPKNAKTIWQGFAQGEWQQHFTLPGEVDSAKVGASLEHGMLRVQLPKAEHMKPRTIRINGSDGSNMSASLNGHGGPAQVEAGVTAPAANAPAEGASAEGASAEGASAEGAVNAASK